MWQVLFETSSEPLGKDVDVRLIYVWKFHNVHNVFKVFGILFLSFHSGQTLHPFLFCLTNGITLLNSHKTL